MEEMIFISSDIYFADEKDEAIIQAYLNLYGQRINAILVPEHFEDDQVFPFYKEISEKEGSCVIINRFSVPLEDVMRVIRTPRRLIFKILSSKKRPTSVINLNGKAFIREYFTFDEFMKKFREVQKI